MTFSPTIESQIARIQAKLREHTLNCGTGHAVNNPTWEEPKKEEPHG